MFYTISGSIITYRGGYLGDIGIALIQISIVIPLQSFITIVTVVWLHSQKTREVPG